MKLLLKRVIYHLFPHEVSGFQTESGHFFEGQIEIQSKNAPPVFISWNAKPCQFSIGYSGQSFFFENVLQLKDVSEDFVWQGLIDKEIELVFFDSDHQILKISFEGIIRYVSSQGPRGDFYNDSLTISKQLPRYNEKLH